MTFRSGALPLVALLLVAATDPPAELVVSGDGIVEASVNGAPARLRIDPSVPAMPIIATAWAQRAQLRPGPFAFAYMIGTEHVNGRSAVARIAIGAGEAPRRRRVGWTDRPFTAAADGVVGPGGLPQPVVRFILGPPRPGERTVSLPMADEGGLFGGWGHSYAIIDLGGAPLRIRFDPHHQRTLATAGAAVRLASANDARIGGEAETTEIAFGVSRPIRSLHLGRPFQVGPLAITDLGVRTTDFGNTASIREQGGDPDEIVVTADNHRNNDRDRIAIGADLLARCSSLVFDSIAHQIRLTCN